MNTIFEQKKQTGHNRLIIGLAIVMILLFILAVKIQDTSETFHDGRGHDTYHWRRYAAYLNRAPEDTGLSAYTHDPYDELMDSIAATNVSLNNLEAKTPDWEKYIAFCGLSGMEKRGLYGAATSRNGRVRVVYPRYDPNLPTDVAITPRAIKILAPRSARATLYANRVMDTVGVPQDSDKGPAPDGNVYISKYTYKD